MGGIPSEVKPELKRLDKTPMTLHEAAKMGSMSAVEDFLAKEMADGVDEKDSRGATALAYAVGANRTEIVKKLLDAKADASEVDTDGNTAVHFAAGYGRTDMIDMLVKKKCDVNKKNDNGMTALTLAAKNGQS